MNCEMAEDNLSAYLDDMLDSPERATVQDHLDGCARCRETLADYRRYDNLLAHLPRVAPPDALRARIFESPEFLALVRVQQEEEQRTDESGAGRQVGRRVATAPPSWAKIGLQVAAVFVLLVGSALLIKQGLFTSGKHTGSTSTSTLGNPGQTAIPLAAGNRLVFVHANALWSAPEAGPGLAQQLTPRGISVDRFNVSPDGHFVAYVDGIHGDLHVIRSDGQSDTTIVQGHGLQLLGVPVWSPDGQQIAYAANSANGPALHLINSSGTNDRVIAASSSRAVSTFGRVIWSADALCVAWVQTTRGAQSLWMYDLVTHKTRQLAAQADPAVAGTDFLGLVWLPDTLHPALSWAADEINPPTASSSGSSTITGAFTFALSSGTAQRLVAPGASLASAMYTGARGDGAWLLIAAGSSATLQAIAANTGVTLGTTTVPASVSIGFWSPDGSQVAYVSAAGDLALWSPGGAAPQRVLSGATGFPYWSPDSSHVAVATAGGVVSVAVGAGLPAGTTHLTAVPAQGSLGAIWAPDEQAVAIVGPSGLAIAASDGSQSRVVEQGTRTGEQPPAWSVAG